MTHSALAVDSATSSVPRLDGKFLKVGTERFLVKGVTYGTFAPDAAGVQFPPMDRVDEDFAAMAAAGFNTVRVYTPPPRELLDRAGRHGLRVMVGLPWAQHVAFLSDADLLRQIRRDVSAHVKALADHEAVLMFALGNEIPPSVVRWHGAERVEEFLRALYEDAKAASPTSLFTYVNFPPTDFLDLSFFDVCAFNVYLHHESDLRAYLARLQQIAGFRPLLLAEAGADSIREGEEGQAALTAMNIRAAFAEGACGSIAFAWTDEWWRGGQDVEDWAFGMVDRQRRPKPALSVVSRAFAEAPFSAETQATWPKVSVVVCAYNAGDTIADCLTSLARLTYPNYEVIVINDGSKDDTAALVAEHPWVRLISIANGGLSAARNLGLREATGTIVAYTDADVRVDPGWLTYLVQPFLTSDVVGSGGPNLVPPDDPFMAQCVALAPGAPTHVLLDDRIAEHVPGCNMAFRRDALLAIGGFNPIYLRAGDDVDACWRLQARGGRIGFAPAALVWHHHRARIQAYWRQQVGYGEGEIWLQPHHPDKFAGGKMIWRGRIYSGLPFVRPLARSRVHTGVWGSSPFPSVYLVGAHPWAFLVHSAPWQIVSFALMLLSAGWLAFERHPLAWLTGLAGAMGLLFTVVRCFQCALDSDLRALPPVGGWPPWASRAAYRLTIAWLHFIQPFARLRGRLRGRVNPPQGIELVPQPVLRAPGPLWRHAWHAVVLAAGGSTEQKYWSETWVSVDHVLTRLMERFQATRGCGRVTCDDGWHVERDVSVAVGRWAWLDVRALIEEHRAGKCLIRFAVRLRPSVLGTLLMSVATGALALMTLLGSVGSIPLVAPGTAAVGCLLLAALFYRTLKTTAAVEFALTGFADDERFYTVDEGQRRTTLVPRAAWQTATVLVAAALGVFQTGSVAAKLVRARLTPPAPAAPVAEVTTLGPPGGLAVAPNGDLYVANSLTDTIKRLRSGALTQPVRAAASGALSDPNGTTVALFQDPAGLAVAPNGDLFVADSQNHRICRVDRRTGVIVTVAGLGVPGFNGDAQPAATAMLNTPRAVTVAANGDLYIADTLNNRIRVVDAKSGQIRTIAGDGSMGRSASDVGDGGLAGRAHLSWPTDIALTPSGDLYVADMRNNRIRRVDARTGVITTVAGDGAFADRGDRGPATAASLAGPSGIALAVAGSRVTIYIADYFNSRVRVVSPNGRIDSLPGGRALPVGAPSRVAYHPGGWLYVADTDRDRVTALPLAPAAPRQATRRPAAARTTT